MRVPALLLAVGLTLPAAAVAKRPKPDPTEGLEAFARSLYAEQVDRMRFEAPVDSDGLVLFVADENGAPIVERGPDGLARMQARFAAWKADGWVMTTTFDDLTCTAGGGLGLGLCTGLVAQAAKQGETDQGVFRLRVTLVAETYDGAWRLVHLHESTATAP